MTFRPEQVAYLLSPIKPERVLRSANVQGSYIAQHDVRAHLTRIFGFGNWGTRIVESVLIGEETTERGGKTYYAATYRVTLCLTVRDADTGDEVSYEDSAAATSMRQPDRGQAHHLGITDATSTALKRAATCLGDQFGLSLYNGGQVTAFVGGTLAWPDSGENPELEEGIVEAEVVSSGSEEMHPVDEEPRGANLQPVEPVQTLNDEPTVDPRFVYDQASEAWLTQLRSIIKIEDAASRVSAIGLLLQAPDVDLQQLIKMASGEIVTFEKLANHFATDAMVTP